MFVYERLHAETAYVGVIVIVREYRFDMVSFVVILRSRDKQRAFEDDIEGYAMLVRLRVRVAINHR